MLTSNGWPTARALQAHVKRIEVFYAQRAIDPAGGYVQYFLDSGEPVLHGTRHLVGSARMAVNWARSARTTGSADDRGRAAHGLAFLEQAHRSGGDGYAWRLEEGSVADDTQHGYGHAFVLLAQAEAARAGITAALPGLARVVDEQTRRYWQPQHGLLVDQWDAAFQVCSPYRGQNSNMHACEALLAAWQASGDPRCLQRAATIADRVTGDLAAQGGGAIWEHYDPDWRVDWDHHRDRPDDRYQPWGFQPGHQAEWARLLLLLHREQPDPRWPHRAVQLFNWAVSHGWDTEHGGLVYSVAPDGRFCNADKVAWVQAEALAAAALLAEHTGEPVYAQWVARLWQHVATHFVHPRHGLWRRWLNRQHHVPTGAPAADNPSDYHSLAACHELLGVLQRAAPCAHDNGASPRPLHPAGGGLGAAGPWGNAEHAA